MSITSLLIVKHAPHFENFYLTIRDILQIPLILTHAQTKSNYTLKKFWPSKFANDPQIFKQGVINDPQKFWSCRNTERGRVTEYLCHLYWFFQTGEQKSSISDTPASTNTFYALVICNQGPLAPGNNRNLNFCPVKSSVFARIASHQFDSLFCYLTDKQVSLIKSCLFARISLHQTNFIQFCSNKKFKKMASSVFGEIKKKKTACLICFVKKWPE